MTDRNECEGYKKMYMRGTFAGWGGKCRNPAKVKRDGKHYCLRHDPVRVQERAEKREKKSQEAFDLKYKDRVFGFRVNGSRIYEIAAINETEAKSKLIDRILEVKIECLGEVVQHHD